VRVKDPTALSHEGLTGGGDVFFDSSSGCIATQLATILHLTPVRMITQT